MKGGTRRRAAQLLVAFLIAFAAIQGAGAITGASSISTFAGGTIVPNWGGEVRDFDTLNAPSAVIVDHTNLDGRIIVEAGGNRIRRLSGNTISTIAGARLEKSSEVNGFPPAGHAGDGGLALAATFSEPTDAAFDAAGNLYVTDSRNHRIRKIDAISGIITTFAGDGFTCPGTQPDTDTYCRVQTDVDPATQQPRYTTVSFRGRFNGDGKLATATSFSYPYGIEIDSQNNIYIADKGNHRIRKIDGQTGIVSTVAGAPGHLDQGDFRRCGEPAFPNGQTWPPLGDGGLATDACLAFPANITLKGTDLYVADTYNHRIRRVNLNTGIIDTAAGSGCKWTQVGYFFFVTGTVTATVNDTQNRPCSFDEAPSTFLGVPDPDGSGPQSQTTYTDAGGPGDGVNALSANLAFPRDVRFDSSGNMYIADTGAAGYDCPPSAPSNEVSNVCAGNRVRKVTAITNVISTVAGDGERATSTNIGDGGLATSAKVNQPQSVLVVNDILEVAEIGNQGPGGGKAGGCDVSPAPPECNERSGKVRRVSLSGIISTIAGTRNLVGCCVDTGVPATLALINNVRGMVVAPSGDVYLADTDHHRILKVAPDQFRTVQTVAGIGSRPQFPTSTINDGGLATAGLLNFPRGLALDSAGNLYVADTENHRIRKVTPGGTISTVAGGGLEGTLPADGDGDAADLAFVHRPHDVAVDAGGNLYIAEPFMQRIRKVNASGVISTFAGSGYICPRFSYNGYEYDPPITLQSCGRMYPIGNGAYTGDKLPTQDAPYDYGKATEAKLNFPMGVAVDGNGNVYIADTANHKIRKVDNDGWITTFAGNGLPMPAFLPQQAASNPTQFNHGSPGDGTGYLQATLAPLTFPHDVVVDSAGVVYIADTYGARVRQVETNGIISTVAGNGCHPGWGSCPNDGTTAASASLRWPVAIAIRGSGLLIAESEAENKLFDQISSFWPPQASNFSPNRLLITLGYKTASGRCDPNAAGTSCTFASNQRVRLVQ